MHAAWWVLIGVVVYVVAGISTCVWVERRWPAVFTTAHHEVVPVVIMVMLAWPWAWAEVWQLKIEGKLTFDVQPRSKAWVKAQAEAKEQWQRMEDEADAQR